MNGTRTLQRARSQSGTKSVRQRGEPPDTAPPPASLLNRPPSFRAEFMLQPLYTFGERTWLGSQALLRQRTEER